MSIYYTTFIARMQILKVAQSELPCTQSIKIDNPVASRQGSFTAPLYVGATPFEELGIQVGPASIQGLVQTSRICYLDLTISKEQIEWVRNLEELLKSLLPGHSTVWFTRDMEKVDIEYFFDSAIRGNILRAEVQRCKAFDTIDVQVFKQSGELADTSLIEKSGNVLALIKVKGITHKAGRLSIDWVLEQILVKQEAECKIGLGNEKQISVSEEVNVKDSCAEDSTIINEQESSVGSDQVNDEEITEVEHIVPVGESVILKSETELVADELMAVEKSERERRRLALRTFMEANGLDPEGYYFPDTDEESEQSEYNENEDVEDALNLSRPEIEEVDLGFSQTSAF